jgi:FYVE/RhoGEF/PH domain-containing protein 5/6
LIVRRHHCRACGSVVCSICSANRAPLKYMGYAPAKVCDPCFNELINRKYSGIKRIT